MIGILTYWKPIAVAVLGLAVAWGGSLAWTDRKARGEGRAAGVAACEAAHREAVDKLNLELDRVRDRAHIAAVDLAVAMESLREQERALDDAARDDPHAGALGPDRLRRLDAIR